MEIKELAKKLGLSEDASEEEVLAKIEADQKETQELKDANKQLVETNNTLATSEAGKQARIDELEKTLREQLEKGDEDSPKTPKTDIEKLVDIK